MKVISVLNRKGGVSKTTTVQMISSCLREKGKKVLMIDLDSQGNLSTFNGAFDGEINQIGNLLTTGKCKIINGMIPANFGLAELETSGKIKDAYVLKNRIARIEVLYKNYDYIIIDTSPSLGLLTLNGVMASDYVVIPTQADDGAFEGTKQTLNIIKDVNEVSEKKIKVLGILLNCFNPRVVLYQKYYELYKETAETYGTKVFKNYIPKGISIQEAQAFKKDILKYGKGSKPVKAYKKFVDEMLKEIK